VSKRTRGTARTAQRRPGARPPTTRPPGTRTRPAREQAPAAPDSQLELATEVAEEIVEDQPATADLPRAARVAARANQPRTRVKPGSLLAARAATEYVYVTKDIRRILVVSVGLFAIMVALYVLLVIARVVPLPFY
jgi:hypothetical protein